jgi:hypothetical protein
VSHETGVGISWNGQLVGYLQQTGVETVQLPQTYKIRGQWIPCEAPATAAFLDRLRESPHVEVRVDGLPYGKTIFSMGLEGEAWLYIVTS